MTIQAWKWNFLKFSLSIHPPKFQIGLLVPGNLGPGSFNLTLKMNAIWIRIIFDQIFFILDTRNNFLILGLKNDYQIKIHFFLSRDPRTANSSKPRPPTTFMKRPSTLLQESGPTLISVLGWICQKILVLNFSKFVGPSPALVRWFLFLRF